jgi:AbrB family looped-hinge helix DNA binding protein
MQLIPENTSRKIDSLGRITLPKGLRDRLSLVEGTDLELATAQEGNNTFIILKCPMSKLDIARDAARTLCALGLDTDIPELWSIAYGDFELKEEE